MVNNYNNVIICCNNGETKLALNVFNNVMLTQQKVQVGKRGRGSITNLIFVKQPAQRFACDSNVVVVDIIQHLVAMVEIR